MAAAIVALVLATGDVATARNSRPALLPIPQPDLDQEEAAVVDQLEAQRAQAESLIEAAVTDAAALAAEMGKLGQLYILYELLAAAEPALVNASMLAPENFHWPYLSATVAQEQRRLDEARQRLERTLELETDYLPALIRLGDVERSAANDAAAQGWYQRALDMAPGSPAANWGLGQIAYGAGEMERAVELFEAVLESRPDATAVHYLLGLAYRDLGRMDKAREHIAQRGESGVELADPLVQELATMARGSRAYMVRGNSAFARGAFDVAAAAYLGAVAAHPENIAAREALASALSRLGRWVHALEQLDWVIENGHASAGTYYNQGAIHAEQGHSEQALAGYERALQLDPDLVGAHLNLALLLDDLGRAEEAASHIVRVLELDPEDTTARIRLASIVAGLGRSSEAVEALSDVLEVDPGNHQAVLALAAIEATNGQTKAALERYAEIISADRDTGGENQEHLARAHFESGQLLLAIDQPESAVEHLRTAVELMPEISEARLVLARGLGRLGQFGAAADEYEDLRSRDPYLFEAHFGMTLSLLLGGRDAEAIAAVERASTAFPQELQFEHLLALILAASPEDSVRDGERALTIAQDLFKRQQTLAHAETLAMALAEVGRFDEAVELQTRIRAEAVRGGQSDLSAIDEHLRLYQRREPVRAPWLADG